MYYPTLEEVRQLKKQGNLVPVCRDIQADLETPVSAYLKIARGNYSFLLERVEGDGRLARYSFIGTEPYRMLSTREGGKTDPLKLTARELGERRSVAVNGLPDFCGGASGYLAYEAVRRWEDLPAPDSDPLALPESVFMFVDSLIVFDHATSRIKVISHAYPNTDTDRAYQAEVSKIDKLVNRLEQPLNCQPITMLDRPNEPAEISSNLTREEFEASVEKARQYIIAGEAIRVVLSQRLSRPTIAHPFNLYQALRDINPSPYMFFLNLKDFQLIGSSPEILVKVANGRVTTRPLAGTRPRGKTPAQDERLEKELRSDEKEKAEHIMLVDLGRNDIGRVSMPGTVQLSELMDVERYSHVMHLVTNIDGRLRPELTPFDALRACFPAGTVSGAPKIRDMEIIAELEPDKRGPYAGCVGYFSFPGNMDTAITIRTIIVNNGIAHVQAGAGIAPALEPAHAIFYAAKLASCLNKKEIIIINLSRRGDKDMDIVAQALGGKAMSVASAFRSPEHKALIAYITVGYPTIEDTLRVVPLLATNGCDIVELGIPFSDPLADGITIQKSSFHALQNGVTPQLCLEVAKKLGGKVNIPLVFMSYFNPIFSYGLEAFCQACSVSGISGLIIPDLPPEESIDLEPVAQRYGLDLIYFLTPTSTEERIELVTRRSSGFIYLVSLTGVTGARDKLPEELESFVAMVREKTEKPLRVGFGVSTPEQAHRVAKVAEGVIVGSRIIQLLDEDKSSRNTRFFIKCLREALS